MRRVSEPAGNVLSPLRTALMVIFPRNRVPFQVSLAKLPAVPHMHQDSFNMGRPSGVQGPRAERHRNFSHDALQYGTGRSSC